jgi:diaminohydroxyphosphoribosylaminopyrimidine deaminase/5-amino-6-(5-phosphoribosylamino)uracil reductase
MVDPDPQVNGKGIAQLRAAGIEVDVGVLEARARRVNEFFIKHRRTGLPFVTVKWAMTLDGKISAGRGRQTMIAGDEALRYVHGLRNLYDAILVGVGTVLADDPRLTCRLPPDTIPAPRNPLRVVVDSRLRTSPAAHIVTGVAEAPTLIVTTREAPAERVVTMRRAGVEVVVQDRAGGPVDLRLLMQDLGRRGMLSVLVEGGGTVNAAVLEAGIADRVVALIAPRLLGGADAPTPVDGMGLANTGGPLRLRGLQLHRLGDDIAIEGDIEGHLEA